MPLLKTNQPTCYIIAGPNGSGKTTFALKNLQNKCTKFINVDEIAKGISPLNVLEQDLIRAGKIFFNELKLAISKRENFAFETTLSGTSYIKTVKNLRQDGWIVILFYLYIPSAEFSAERVAVRVANGGHNVPQADINRRYPRSIKNLFIFKEICDACYCLDNRGEKPTPIFSQQIGQKIQIFNAQIMSEIRKVINND